MTRIVEEGILELEEGILELEEGDSNNSWIASLRWVTHDLIPTSAGVGERQQSCAANDFCLNGSEPVGELIRESN